MPYVLYVVVFFETIEKLLHVLDLILVGKSYVVGRNHFCFSGKEGITLLAESFAYSAEIFGSGVDLVNFFFDNKVFRIELKNIVHKLFFGVFFFVDYDNTLLGEEPVNGSCLAEVAAEFIKIVTYVCSGSVSVFGNGFNDNCDACGTVAFVGDLFVRRMLS